MEEQVFFLLLFSFTRITLRHLGFLFLNMNFTICLSGTPNFLIGIWLEWHLNLEINLGENFNFMILSFPFINIAYSPFFQDFYVLWKCNILFSLKVFLTCFLFYSKGSYTLNYYNTGSFLFHYIVGEQNLPPQNVSLACGLFGTENSQGPTFCSQNLGHT